jgi:hypothetical protein
MFLPIIYSIDSDKKKTSRVLSYRLSGFSVRSILERTKTNISRNFSRNDDLILELRTLF